jgi:transposase
MRVRAADQGRRAAGRGGAGAVRAADRGGHRVPVRRAVLSKQRTAQALAELFGVPLSSGTVAALTARAAGRLGGFLEHVRGQIAAAEVAGFDETGFRVQGRLHWVHCARTGKYTLLMVHPKRGTEATKAMGVLGSFAGVAVHDAWARTTPIPVLSTSCAVRTPSASCRPSPTPRPRASGAGPPRPPRRSPRCRTWCTGRSARAVTPWTRPRWPPRSACTAPRSWPGQPDCRPLRAADEKHHALARRLLGRQDDYLRFTTDFRAPPDNNGSDCDIRMAKLRQKVSGCLRTLTGARQFCAIRSYLSSAAKHGIGFFDAFVMLTKGEPWMPATNHNDFSHLTSYTAATSGSHPHCPKRHHHLASTLRPAQMTATDLPVTD